MQLKRSSEDRSSRIAHLSQRAMRSREKLKVATRKLLNHSGPDALQVQEIARRAGVAHGLFYRYFRDAEEVLLEVAQDFMDDLNTDTKAIPPSKDLYQLFYEYHLLAVQKFVRNPGVVRCLFQLTHKHPQLDRIWKAGVHEWNLRMAALLQEVNGLPAPTAELLAFALGAMTEGVLLQYFIRHTEDLEHIVESPEDIAELIAVLWYRTVFLQDPPAAKLRVMKPLVVTSRRRRVAK